MEQYFQQHLARIDRLMTIIEANNPYESSLNGLSFYDIVIFACQSMWHLKDWILNDKNFGAADIDALTREIHAEPCLLLCSDIANGSKHFLLKHPKIAGGFKQRKGFMLDSRKSVLQEL
ncbi:MAG TPA: hypothetical protein PLM98_05890, partial [Thiolinea sp.]|nr:hypothetical protein [Thiolinea sp.]